jgi:hypothetical protein
MHCPDLAVEVEGARWAVEVEFSVKGRERLRRILAAYGGSEYVGVVYYVREAALASVISRLSLDCGLNGRLRLRPGELWPSPSHAPAEIERIAREHRTSAIKPGNDAAPPRGRSTAGRESDRRERERMGAINAWERQVERRDKQEAGRRLRLGRRRSGELR